MPLGTVDRTPPPFFKQGPSALSKLLVLSTLAVLLMVMDARLHWAAPLRSAITVALYPAQWLALQPLKAVQWANGYVGSLAEAQRQAGEARAELVRQADRAAIVEHLAHENRELRSLLGMQEKLPTQGIGAEILYELSDPYTQRVAINRGQLHGIVEGSPVMDGFGVLGQVTRVFPATAEVTLVTDRRLAVPVVNARTGLRSLAYGSNDEDGGLELRFVSVNSDTQVGDVLTTSGIDGTYPPGLPVARVERVSVRDGSGFARIECSPMARPDGVRYVLVVRPAHPEQGSPSEGPR